MSTLRQKFGKSMLQRGIASARAGDVSGNWLRRLGAAATNHQAKENHGQLQSMLDFYNKPFQPTRQQEGEIDWEGYRNAIHTPGVVDKIHTKFEGFMASEYGVDAAVARCGNTTEKMQALDVAMQWNYTLYMIHYLEHLNQLETMRNAGDITSMSNFEVSKLMPYAERFHNSNYEIGNIAPPDNVEDAIPVRLCTQFSWGSRYCPPFWHSQESTSSIAATLGKFGN